MINNTERVNVLISALPYIQQYYGKIVVIKYGGAAMLDDGLRNAVMSDIVLLSLCGIKIVLVHGGGPEINDMLKKIGKKPKFINGLRHTDRETMDIVQSALCGKVNKDLVALLATHKGRAIGLCGLDGGLLTARQLSEELGFVGEITDVKPDIIHAALKDGYIPVIATVAGGESANAGAFNINADTAAAKIAAAMGAENLILMTDVKGLLEDAGDENTLIKEVRLNEVPLLKESGIISGGMLPKIDCCVEAVRRRVKKANIIDGRIPHSILLELLTDEGAGTMFV